MVLTVGIRRYHEVGIIQYPIVSDSPCRYAIGTARNRRRPAAADDEGCDEQRDLVDQLGVVERPVDRWPSFDEQRRDLAAGEIRPGPELPAETRALGLTILGSANASRGSPEAGSLGVRKPTKSCWRIRDSSSASLPGSVPRGWW